MMGAGCEREQEQGFWDTGSAGLRLAQPSLAVLCTITFLSSVKRVGELVKQKKTKSQQLMSSTNLLPSLCHPFAAGFFGCPYAKSSLAGLRLE